MTHDDHSSDRAIPGLANDLTASDLAAVLAVAEKAARAAGALLRTGFGTLVEVEHKGEIDLVTAYDRASEEMIVQTIRAHFPEDAILAEEGSIGGPDERRRWVIDPLDGTTNYAHGFPHVAVSIAFQLDGRVVAGVVYDPLRDELFSARLGGGARLNGRRLRVSSVAVLRQALVASGFPYDPVFVEQALARWAAMTRLAQGVRRAGAAALDLAYVAAGRLDAFWEEPLAPWDTAAGALLVQEAGGRVTDLRGRPYAIERPDIVATNGPLHDAVLAAVRHAQSDSS